MFTCALMMAASISGGEIQACHRRSRCNDCCEIIYYDCNPCNGGSTVAPGTGPAVAPRVPGAVTPIPAPTKKTAPATGIKMSKDVSDLIKVLAPIH